MSSNYKMIVFKLKDDYTQWALEILTSYRHKAISSIGEKLAKLIYRRKRADFVLRKMNDITNFYYVALHVQEFCDY